MGRGIGSTRVAKRQILGKKGVEKVPFSMFLYRIRNRRFRARYISELPIPSHSMLGLAVYAVYFEEIGRGSP